MKPDWDVIYRIEAELGMDYDHFGAPSREEARQTAHARLRQQGWEITYRNAKQQAQWDRLTGPQPVGPDTSRWDEKH